MGGAAESDVERVVGDIDAAAQRAVVAIGLCDIAIDKDALGVVVKSRLDIGITQDSAIVGDIVDEQAGSVQDGRAREHIPRDDFAGRLAAEADMVDGQRLEQIIQVKIHEFEAQRVAGVM